MKNIKKSELNIVLKDADPQSIQGEINVDKTKNEFEIHVKGKFLIKKPKLMESKMSKEEMTQFSLIIKEAIKESNKSLTQEIASIKTEFTSFKTEFTSFKTEFTSFKNDVNKRFDKIEKNINELKSDVKAIKNTPTMKKELEL